MDQGTQEKAVVVKTTKPYAFDPSWSVICKGCKALHNFGTMYRVRTSYVTFPKGDFSIIRLYCPYVHSYHDYKNQEEIMIPQEEVASDTVKVVQLLSSSVRDLNTRVAELERSVGRPKTEEEQKSLRERLDETEKITTQIAERLLPKDEIPQPVKETPKGQLA